MQREKIKSTQEQEPLWGRAAFIARVWIGLDRQAISLTIVHPAFENTHQFFEIQYASGRRNYPSASITNVATWELHLEKIRVAVVSFLLDTSVGIAVLVSID